MTSAPRPPGVSDSTGPPPHSIAHSAKSHWLRNAGTYTANADLAESVDCDLLVIGGGVAGLSSALHAAQAGIGKVLLIESEIIGFGATGRSAGWIIPQFGMDQLSIRAKYGRERSGEAISYARAAVSYTEELIDKFAIQSDYRRPGLMRTAFDDRWIDDLEALHKAYVDMGFDDLAWLSANELQSEYNGNDRFRSAIFDPNVGLLDPVKQVRGLKKAAEDSGVEIYENTPALQIDRDQRGIRVYTPCGSISPSRLVLATNAYTHQLQGSIGSQLRRVQSPVFARGAITEQIPNDLWRSLGWHRGNAIESCLDLFHYMAPTTDQRIQFYFIYYGGHPVMGEMEPAACHDGAVVSLRHLQCIFPQLKDIGLAHNWGGHMSGTRDLVPHLSCIGDDRVIYIGGCWGHGLALSHLHGKTVADLLRGVSSELTDCWFVNRRPAPWPPFPLDYIGKQFAWNHMKRKVRRQIQNSIFTTEEPLR